MSFQKYLNDKYGQPWSELCLQGDVIELIKDSIDYEVYCHSKNIVPSWSD